MNHLKGVPVASPHMQSAVYLRRTEAGAVLKFHAEMQQTTKRKQQTTTGGLQGAGRAQ